MITGTSNGTVSMSSHSGALTSAPLYTSFAMYGPNPEPPIISSCHALMTLSTRTMSLTSLSCKHDKKCLEVEITSSLNPSSKESSGSSVYNKNSSTSASLVGMDKSVIMS